MRLNRSSYIIPTLCVGGKSKQTHACRQMNPITMHDVTRPAHILRAVRDTSLRRVESKHASGLSASCSLDVTNAPMHPSHCGHNRCTAFPQRQSAGSSLAMPSVGARASSVLQVAIGAMMSPTCPGPEGHHAGSTSSRSSGAAELPRTKKERVIHVYRRRSSEISAETQ